MNLDHLFNPKSIAVVGASRSPGKVGTMTLLSIIGGGFKGEIYPINPKEEEISGLKAYKSVKETPSKADIAIICVPTSSVPQVVKECAGAKVRFGVVISSGFGEVDKKGKDLQQEVVKIARKGGMRLIGPNCMGMASSQAHFYALMNMLIPMAGDVSVVSQSGTLGSLCMVYASEQSVGFNKFISSGNEADLHTEDFIEYLALDPETKVIFSFLEGIRDGRKFLSAAKEATKRKPFIVLKGGMTEAGAKAASSHTGSMAGSSLIWPSAIKAAGAIAATDTKDLVECLMAFQCLESFRGNSAGVLAGGGLRCVEALDAASDHGFIIPKLDAESLEEIQKYLPPSGGVAGNPIDLANPMLPPKALIPMLKIMAAQDDVQFLLLYQMLFYIVNALKAQSSANGAPIEYHTDIAKAGVEIRRKTGKPMAVIMPEIASDPAHSDIEVARITARYHYTSQGIPCFDESGQAFSVLKRVNEYYSRKSAL